MPMNTPNHAAAERAGDRADPAGRVLHRAARELERAADDRRHDHRHELHHNRVSPPPRAGFNGRSTAPRAMRAARGLELVGRGEDREEVMFAQLGIDDATFRSEREFVSELS
jgi:hypothetical protein